MLRARDEWQIDTRAGPRPIAWRFPASGAFAEVADHEVHADCGDQQQEHRLGQHGGDAAPEKPRCSRSSSSLKPQRACCRSTSALLKPGGCGFAVMVWVKAGLATGQSVLAHPPAAMQDGASVRTRRV